MCGDGTSHKNEGALSRLGIEENFLNLKSNIYQKSRAKAIFYGKKAKTFLLELVTRLGRPVAADVVGLAWGKLLCHP